MSTPFQDQDGHGYQRQSVADMRRARLRVVRTHIVADETEADRQHAEHVQTLALGTDAANYVIADLAACPGVRAFVDAVIGVTGGGDEFVYVTDKDLAGRMGVSTATVATYRKQFMAVKNYSALIEIKHNYRDPTTNESFPHRYRCKVTALAVEAMQNAQLAPGWTGDTDAKMRAMKEAAETVARGASFGALTPPKKRKRPTDAEVLASSLKAARQVLEKARKRFSLVKNPDFEQIAELFKAVETEVKDASQAFGFATHVSIQIQREEDGNPSEADSPDFSDLSRRVEAEDLPLGANSEVAETQVETAQVEKSLTCNDSTESTTCGNGEIPQKPPDQPSPMSLYIQEGERIIDEEMANGATESEAREAARLKLGDYPEWRQARADIWERSVARLKGGGRRGN
jgi:hypothetical protein